MQAEKDHKLWEKQRKAEQEEMARREQKRREEDKRRQEQPAVPRGYTQFNMLLSGKYPRYQFGNHYSIPMSAALVGIPSKIHQQEGHGIKVIDIERGLNYMRQLYSECKLIQLDDDTHKRLMDFTKDDGENILELINRLLDSATKK
jgi:hypothetical protein